MALNWQIGKQDFPHQNNAFLASATFARSTNNELNVLWQASYETSYQDYAVEGSYVPSSAKLDSCSIILFGSSNVVQAAYGVQ
ncbi:hypothetical protein Mapa_002769 [Marchantia paleacea]|nr:hypothetical protein Mapa_002769 [Marchantia paleacea]